MKVVMTQTASESLWPIYLYHLDYSQDYAETFQYDLDSFILERLTVTTKAGKIVQAARPPTCLETFSP